jgi:hypothetical protein
MNELYQSITMGVPIATHAIVFAGVAVALINHVPSYRHENVTISETLCVHYHKYQPLGTNTVAGLLTFAHTMTPSPTL